MRIITASQIESLSISPSTCIEWVTESFKMKPQSQCPAKPSVHPQGNDFITTMPALLPPEFKTFGVKVVSRASGRHPALRSDITLYDTETGGIKAILDGNWITAMRTGAVAALAARTLRSTGAANISMIGLGSTAHTTMKCLADAFCNEQLSVRLMAYKNQAEQFADDFRHLENTRFTIVDNAADFMRDSRIVISCITDADGLLIDNDALFEPGVLVIPVHTRGFQNCDLFFDKVYGDDTDHVRGFRYFSRFRRFAELTSVLTGRNPGRESDEERILSYNIGIGLHDVLFSYKILQMLA